MEKSYFERATRFHSEAITKTQIVS